MNALPMPGHHALAPLMPIRMAAVMPGEVRTKELPHTQAIIERQMAMQSYAC
ncbi:MAG: hypothetical protein ACT4PZ_12545 [Panacagrimonas sp.]